MKINTTKCKTLHLSAKNPRISYSCQGLVIPTVSIIRDLGLIPDEKLSFCKHSIMIQQKLLKLIAIIFKTFISSNINLYLLAYRTYVLHLLDYCPIFYSHNSASNSALIEKVQKILTRNLYLKAQLHSQLLTIPKYQDRLQCFHLSDLRPRFVKSDLLILYKIINNLVSVLSFSIKFSIRHANLIFISPIELSLYKNFFFHCSLVEWNKHKNK